MSSREILEQVDTAGTTASKVQKLAARLQIELDAAFLYKLHEVFETSTAGLEIPKWHVARAHFVWLLRLQCKAVAIPRALEKPDDSFF